MSILKQVASIILILLVVLGIYILVRWIKNISTENISDNIQDSDYLNCEMKIHDINFGISGVNIQSFLENYIKTNLNEKFEINDYLVLIEDDFIKYIYAPNEIKTNNSYTAILKNNTIISVNECIAESFESLEVLENKTLFTTEKEEQLKKELLTSFKNNESDIIIVDSGYIYKSGKVQYYIIYNQENPSQLPSRNIKYYDINEK